MYCPKCGTQNDDNNFRCTQCNEVIQAIPAAPMPPPSKDLADDPAIRVLIPVGVSGMAMIAGYLGLFSVLLLPAPFALLTGILALGDLKKNPKKHGKGRAWFAVIMGVICTVLLMVVLVGLIGKSSA